MIHVDSCHWQGFCCLGFPDLAWQVMDVTNSASYIVRAILQIRSAALACPQPRACAINIMILGSNLGTELIVVNGVMGPPVNGLKSMGDWGYFTPTSGVTTQQYSHFIRPFHGSYYPIYKLFFWGPLLLQTSTALPSPLEKTPPRLRFSGDLSEYHISKKSWDMPESPLISRGPEMMVIIFNPFCDYVWVRDFPQKKSA